MLRKFHMRPIVMLSSQQECSVLLVTNPAVNVQCFFLSPPERDVCLIQVEHNQRILSDTRGTAFFSDRIRKW